jgi:hypothetical protein
VSKDVVELSLFTKIANVKISDCVTDAVPAIGGTIRVAGVRRFVHPDTNPANWNGRRG